MGCDPATAPAPGGVVIAGAGLAGCLAAVTAARQGHQVDVFELRPDSRPDSKAWQGRSINLALSTRGLTALAEVGLAEPVQRLGVPMYGRMLHSVSGETSEQAYGTSRAQHLLSVSRRALNELLCDAVEREPNARLHFQHKILSVDLPGPNRRGRSERDGNEVASASEEPRCGVTVQNVSSGGGMAAQKEVVEAGLLIGADGAWSKVRQSMQRDADTRLDFSLDYCPHSYKELSIPAGADGKHVLPPNFLHIWPRGEFMLIALPDLEGSFTCTLFIPQKQIEAAGLDDDQRPGQRERVASFFDRWFPDVVPHMPTLIDDCVGNPTLPLVTIRCAPYHHEHSGACVILGDAAHAIVPFYGQGCNAAFEDVRILGGLLQGVTPATTATATTSTSASEASAAGGVSDGSSSGSDSNKVESRFRPVCEEFTRLRKRNADAIAELALEHYADMGVSTLSPLFLLRRSADNVVGRLLSGWYMSEYHMVSFSNLPYADSRARAIRNELRIQRLVTAIGLVGTVGAIVGGAWALRLPLKA